MEARELGLQGLPSRVRCAPPLHSHGTSCLLQLWVLMAGFASPFSPPPPGI